MMMRTKEVSMRERLKTLDPSFRKILKLTTSLSGRLGFRAYLVGGVARDLLLGKNIYDLDIVIEGSAIALCQKLCASLGVDSVKHHTFGTATICFQGHRIDFATARKETYQACGALPKVVPAGLREDLFRRDFTVNAMAISINKDDYGALIDFYDGSRDLHRAQLRVLHDASFLDDPTRLLRAVRFEQRLGFTIEAHTRARMREAIRTHALSHVHAHRLRDELELILKERMPLRYIARVQRILGFSFVDARLRLSRKNFDLLSRIEKTLEYYETKFNRPLVVRGAAAQRSTLCLLSLLRNSGGPSASANPTRKIEGWLVYLMGILAGLPSRNISIFLEKFSLRKGERIRVLSAKEGLKSIQVLKKNLKPHQVYRALYPYSFESVIFFYAFFTHAVLRRNIDNYLEYLVHVRLRIKGDDLARAGVAPSKLYGRVFEQVLYAKLDDGFKTKREELRAAKTAARRLRNLCAPAGS